MMDGLIINGDPEPVELVLERPEGRQMSQDSVPLGNLVVSGGYGETSGGMFIHVRQQAPDTTRPAVAYHIPQNNRTNYSRHMPISVIIHEELDSETLHNGTHFSVEKVTDDAPDGNPVECIVNFGSNLVLTLTPTAPLDGDATYQVTFTAGGKHRRSG